MTSRLASAAVFLDKDGTVIENLHHNVDPALMRWAPGAAEGLPLLYRAGFRLVIVSNQPGVALGLFSPTALRAVERRLRTMFAGVGVELAGCFFCPHFPDGSEPRYARPCDCRKPQPGLIRQAARRLGIDLSRSWMVGDILDDVEAGRRAGVRTVLIDNGNETEWQTSDLREPHVRVRDMQLAARFIVAQTAERRAAHAVARTTEGTWQTVN